MRHFLRWSAALLIALAANPVQAAPTRDSLVVNTGWLAQHVNDADLVLLHVGEKAEYDAGHIPHARFITLRDISAARSGDEALTLEMADPETLRTQLAALGISDNSHIVVYYGNDWVSPSTRVMFTLLFAGLEKVSLLDGGMKAWTKDGHPLTADVPTPAAGHLSPLKPKPLVVDFEFVRAHTQSPGYSIVDSRAAEFFDGSQMGGPRDHRKAGHIPGARSVPFTTITTDDLKVKSTNELAAAFEHAGVGPGDTVVTYCHIGQQATATLFGAMLAGHPVLLYDGSFEDWSRRDLPVEKKP